MARYIASETTAAVQSLETAALGTKRVAWLSLRADSAESAIKKFAQLGIAATVLSTSARDGMFVIVATTTLEDATILRALAEQGAALSAPAAEKKKFNPWAWRGITSIVGQSLQIAASFASKGSTADRAALFGFASLNLAANFINIVFGAQEKKDAHQLRYLKTRINETVGSVAETAIALPAVDDSRTDARPKDPVSANQQFKNFLNKYSVSFGEIGLRTVGSVSLAFPITKWGKAAKAFNQGGIKAAYLAGKNDNRATFLYGLMMLVGKFTSFTASEPDPYNPEPPSLLRQFREKVAFRLSSVIEGAGAAYQTYDRFAKQKISIGGKLHPDYYGGIGSAVFVGGYGIRLGAPYGTREVDMKELYAHVSDALAQLPHEKIPDALANISATLADHFKTKKLEAPTIYAAIATDLAATHRIALGVPAQEPATAKLPGRTVSQPHRIAALDAPQTPLEASAQSR